MSAKYCLILLNILLFPAWAMASSSLLYLELQAVAGYDISSKERFLYSHQSGDAMQKPSAGFDLVKVIAADYGNWGVFALQARIAYNDKNSEKYEFQLYNGYLKKKLGFTDVWVGHNKPAFGLLSVLDTHGWLLQTLAMEGFGFDRDWGFGIYKAFQKSDLGVSAGLGSGMEMYFDGNYQICARYSLGVLEKDNRSLGISLSRGQIIAPHMATGGTMENNMAGADFSCNIDNYELKLEAVSGIEDDESVYGVLLRISVNLLEENRLKLEFQPVLKKQFMQEEGFLIYSGISYNLNESIALRSMYSYDNSINEKKLTGQVYAYFKV